MSFNSIFLMFSVFKKENATLGDFILIFFTDFGDVLNVKLTNNSVLYSAVLLTFVL